MEKISWKFLLQCGFQYQYTEKKELLGFKLLNNAKFNFTYWEYDLELDGEIQQNIVCFKSFNVIKSILFISFDIFLIFFFKYNPTWKK